MLVCIDDRNFRIENRLVFLFGFSIGRHSSVALVGVLFLTVLNGEARCTDSDFPLGKQPEHLTDAEVTGATRPSRPSRIPARRAMRRTTLNHTGVSCSVQRYGP